MKEFVHFLLVMFHVPRVKPMRTVCEHYFTDNLNGQPVGIYEEGGIYYMAHSAHSRFRVECIYQDKEA